HSYTGESRDSPVCTCTPEVWSFGPSRNDGEYLPPHEPDQQQTHDRRDDADDPQDIVRRCQRALHRPAHPGRAGGKHQAFEHKEDAHTDEEVGERYGPHRITPPAKRLLLLCGEAGPNVQWHIVLRRNACNPAGSKASAPRPPADGPTDWR